MTSKKQSLETITGTLYECVTQCVPETALTSAELTTERRDKTTERRDNADLRGRWLWTANFPLYQIEDGEAVLYFGGRKANPLFNNIREATNQLKANQNYRPTEKDITAVLESVKSGDTLRVELSDLNLDKLNDEFSYFEINPNKIARLNSVQRALAERVYDSGNDFVENMKMFAKAEINPRIYVLNPEYVQKEARNGAVARACWLNNFGNNSGFVADERNVDDHDYALRGVRRASDSEQEAPIGADAQKAIVLPDFNKVLGYSQRFVSEAARPEFEAGLRKLYNL
ncbi:MAG: hypothetical protein AABW48_02165 [Nanoarchaeota archaeon]